MTEQHHKDTRNTSHPGGPKPLGIVLCLGALAGVLIWAKLRLVTDIPLSAYADPREQMEDSTDSDISDHDLMRPDSESATSHDTQP